MSIWDIFYRDHPRFLNDFNEYSFIIISFDIKVRGPTLIKGERDSSSKRQDPRVPEKKRQDTRAPEKNEE